MALLFPKKQRAVLGVDLGATALKIVELDRSNAGLSLKSIATVPIAPGVIVAHTIQDIPALGAALRLALSEAKVSATDAAIALPATLVISKTLLVDALLSDEELEASVQLEAAASIPYPLDEVYRDFCVLGLDEKDTSKTTVLLVAARKQVVDSRIQVLKDAGLEVTCVEVRNFVLERMVNYLNSLQPMGKTIAVVEIDVLTITFNVVHDSYALYSREEPCGNVISIEIDAFIPLLRRFMQLFFSSGHSGVIDRILFIGTGPCPENLCEQIRESLSIPCLWMDPFKNMVLSDPLQHAASSFAIACGLALRNHYDGD